jgi:hypothetical protein
MAVQTREQGRYLGGRPSYGYRLADAGPHPNKVHASWAAGEPAGASPGDSARGAVDVHPAPAGPFGGADRVLAQLPVLHLVLTGAVGGEGRRPRRTRQGVDARQSASIEEAISYLRENEITLTYDQAAASLRPGEAIKTITTKAS